MKYTWQINPLILILERKNIKQGICVGASCSNIHSQNQSKTDYCTKCSITVVYSTVLPFVNVIVDPNDVTSYGCHKSSPKHIKYKGLMPSGELYISLYNTVPCTW